MNGQYYAIEMPEEAARREELNAYLIIAFARYLRAAPGGSVVVVPESLARFLETGEMEEEPGTDSEATLLA